MVTLDELKALLKEHRWIISEVMTGKQKVYAAKQRQGKKVVTRYLATEHRLDSLTAEDILAKLNRTITQS
jgi:pyruvate/2-oxoacid:ferredoxin oxidoreductase beta subunit